MVFETIAYAVFRHSGAGGNDARRSSHPRIANTCSIDCGVYTLADIERVRALSATLPSISAIARATGIARSTIRSWLLGTPAWVNGPRQGACPECAARARARDRPAEYAYLLGLYLGDGHISTGARVDRMRISLDAKYPAIIASACAAIEAVSGRRANTVSAPGCEVAYGYSKHWRCVFPQAGPGPKHKRAIVLEPWQRELVERAPEALIRGLVHSDGCRIVHTVAGHQYVRYFFSNKSADIHGIFRGACDQLGIRWTASRVDHTSIARRESIAAMDRFVGPKR
jgi:hypothetical protein